MKVPASVILKSKQWSLSNDKLAEINQAALLEFTILTQPHMKRSNTKSLGHALRTYVEREIIKKLKQNTWNWIVANKIEYVNFMANNYDKFKDWYLKKYMPNTEGNEREKLQMIIFSKRLFYKMMHFFGLGKDKDTLGKIFWVLDKDDSGEIDYIEFVLGIQMMKQNSFKEKLITFFDMCDLDGDGYVDKKMFSMIKKELKFNNSGKKLGNMMDQISRQELIERIEDQDFLKDLKPFHLADYFKDYESLMDIQSNNVSNLANILKAYESKEKIKEKIDKYLKSI